MGNVQAGTVWLRAYIKGAKRQPALELRCLLGTTPPKVVEGYAAYQQITRPKRKAVTEWIGTIPLKIEIPIVIDYWRQKDGESCEKDIRTLELMAGASQKEDDDDHPPLLLWDANAMHDNREASHLRWVIERIEWGSMLWNSTPNICRAEATVTIMEWVEDEFLTSGTGAKKNRRSRKKSGKGRKGRKGTYVVTAADLNRGLRGIAKKKLGDSKRWREIAKVQKPPIRDPMNIKIGQELRMP